MSNADGPVIPDRLQTPAWETIPKDNIEHPMVTGPYGQPITFEWVVKERCPVCGAGMCAFSDPRPDADLSIRTHCSRCDYEAPRRRTDVEVARCGS